MAQKMIDIKNMNAKINGFKREEKNKDNKLAINYKLSKNKFAKLYYCKPYKSNVLNLNIHKSKSFIITKQIWIELKKHTPEIDKALDVTTIFE